MHLVIETLRQHPEIAIFLTLAIGFWFGSLKFGSFSLGAVTSTLVAGLIVGQLDIPVPALVETVFFTMFLFGVGYGVGPQFFRALKSNGLPQIAFTLLVAASGLLCAVVLGKALGYSSGLAAGLLAGAYTNSGTLGVATAYFSQLGLGPRETHELAALAAIAYAVTYPFGAGGAAWFLSKIGPKIFRVDLGASSKELERQVGYREVHPGVSSAYQAVQVRAFRVENHEVAGTKALDLPTALGVPGVYVTRVRQNGGIGDPNGRTIVQDGATVVLAGRPGAVLAAARKLGPEVEDPELVGYPVEQLDVVITRRDMVGQTIGQVESAEQARVGRGVFVSSVTRDGQAVKTSPDLALRARDVLTLLGARTVVEDSAAHLGYADRKGAKSDIASMGLAVVIGGLIGAVTIRVGSIPLSLSTSVGVLIAGLVSGYVHDRYRSFGQVPAPALWVFNNVGLNGYIAVTGLGAAGGLVSGLKSYGITLFVAGIVVSIVPLVVAVYAAKYLFKFQPVIALGASAGARSTTPGLGALQEAANSQIPALGYTVPYAVARIILALFGVLIVLLTR